MVQSWNFTNCGPELYQIRIFFATTEKSSTAFFDIFCKTSQLQNWVKKNHGKSRNDHGKVMVKYVVISQWEHCTRWPHVGVNGGPNLNLTPLFNQVSQK